MRVSNSSLHVAAHLQGTQNPDTKPNLQTSSLSIRQVKQSSNFNSYLHSMKKLISLLLLFICNCTFAIEIDYNPEIFQKSYNKGKNFKHTFNINNCKLQQVKRK
jgi:hypothetical protein